MNKIAHKKKNALLAAILNAWPIPLGLGYVYLNRWLRFLSVLGLQIGIPMILEFLGYRDSAPCILSILWLGSVVDAYRMAQNHNRFINSLLRAQARWTDRD